MQKAVKKRRLGVSENGIIRKKAESINDVWCWDLIHDRPRKTDAGGCFRGHWLVIEDEFTPGNARVLPWRCGVRSRRATCWTYSMN
jgi:hypothetical protein